MRPRSFFVLYTPRAIRWALVAFLIIQIGYFCLAWLYPSPLSIGPWTMRISPSDLTMDEVRLLPSVQRWLGAALASANLALLIYGGFRLQRMLQEIEAGALFAVSTIGHLRAFAGAILLSVLAAIVQLPLRELLFRVIWGNGAYSLKLSVNSQELQLILICGVFYLIAAIMQEGQRLADDNAGFV